jgi:hypothetical protein
MRLQSSTAQVVPRNRVPRESRHSHDLAMVKWDHDKSWFAYKFTEFIASDAEQRDYNVSNDYEEFKHVAGHVIDGLLD